MWWICLLSAHNCKTFFPSVIPELPTAALTDASLSGGGCLWATDWMYANWVLNYLSLYSLHINYKETFTTVLGAHRWTPFWSGHRVIIKTDSQVAVVILNKSSTCCPVIMDWIRSLFWLKEYCNFSLLVKHIPGTTNTLPGSNDFESCPTCLLLSLDPRDQQQLDREVTHFRCQAYVPTWVKRVHTYPFVYTTVTSLSEQQH